jgi:hypothetical protein
VRESVDGERTRALAGIPGTSVNAFFFQPNGRVRVTRMVVTMAILVFFAMFGAGFMVFIELFTKNTGLKVTWLVVFVVLAKLPLITFCWWLIARNKEVPGVPVVWSEEETREILGALIRQARQSLEMPDTAPRLAYLSREAWHVADRADGAVKADAVGVALEIDRLAARHGHRRIA